MKYFLSSAMFALAMIIPVEGRVGETEVECEARYGKGLEVPLQLSVGLSQQQSGSFTAKRYATHGLIIRVVFDNGRAVLVRYGNEAVFTLDGKVPPTLQLAKTEMEYLRQAHRPGRSVWADHEEPMMRKIAPTLRFWRTNDRTLYAGYDRERKQFFVCTSKLWQVVIGQMSERYEAIQKGKAAGRLKGL